MATDFNKNALVIGGGIKPSTKNTPGDIRTRVNAIADIESIPLPFVGMIFYVEENQTFYVVKSLEGKKVGAISIPDSIVGEYVPLHQGYASIEFVEEMLGEVSTTPGPEGPQGPEGPAGAKGEDGHTPVKGVDYFTEEEIAELRYDDSEVRAMILAEAEERDIAIGRKIAEVINGAPEAMDTLHELAEAIEMHQDVYEAFIQVNNEALANEVAERKEEDEVLKARLEALEMIDHEEFLKEHQDISHLAVKEEVNAELKAMKEELEEKIDEEKPYLDNLAAYPTSKFLFACGQPMTVEPNKDFKYDAEKPEDAVAFVYRWAEGFEAIVVEAEEAKKVYLVGGYGHKNVGVKRAIPQTNMILRDVKIKGVVGGNYFEGMVGHVNIEAENCEFVSVMAAGWCGASVDGQVTRMNIADDINVKMNNCKISSTFFGGAQGNGVADDVHVEFNNCEIGWLTAGGANGMTRNAVIEMNGGSVQVAQSTNRGIVYKAKFIMNDGVVNKLYFGGETEDSSVNGIIEEGFVELNGGEIKQFCFGTNNGVELQAEDMKGFIKECNVKAGDISALEKIQVEKEIEKRIFMINESGLEIELPEEAKDFDEVHIFVKHKAGEIKVKDDACKWQADMPELVEGRMYELIFTKVANMWLAGCIEYK